MNLLYKGLGAGAVIIGIATVGKLDLQYALVDEAVVQERHAQVQRHRDTVLRPRRPADCDAIGKQYVAWRDAKDEHWSHDCVDVRLGIDAVPPQER